MQLLPYLRFQSSLQSILLASTSVSDVLLKIFTKIIVSSHLFISYLYVSVFFNLLASLLYYCFHSNFFIEVFFDKKILKANC